MRKKISAKKKAKKKKRKVMQLQKIVLHKQWAKIKSHNHTS